MQHDWTRVRELGAELHELGQKATTELTIEERLDLHAQAIALLAQMNHAMAEAIDAGPGLIWPKKP